MIKNDKVPGGPIILQSYLHNFKLIFIFMGWQRSHSFHFVNIGFLVCWCSSLFQHINNSFCQVLHIFIFFFFQIWHKEWGIIFESMPHFSNFFSKSWLFLKQLFDLLKRVCWPFLLVFQSVYYVFLTCSARFNCCSSSNASGWGYF